MRLMELILIETIMIGVVVILDWLISSRTGIGLASAVFTYKLVHVTPFTDRLADHALQQFAADVATAVQPIGPVD